jgi:hypothetical protein
MPNQYVPGANVSGVIRSRSNLMRPPVKIVFVNGGLTPLDNGEAAGNTPLLVKKK